MGCTMNRTEEGTPSYMRWEFTWIGGFEGGGSSRALGVVEGRRETRLLRAMGCIMPSVEDMRENGLQRVSDELLELPDWTWHSSWGA